MVKAIIIFYFSCAGERGIGRFPSWRGVGYVTKEEKTEENIEDKGKRVCNAKRRTRI
jgi:hypothetical protein